MPSTRSRRIAAKAAVVEEAEPEPEPMVTRTRQSERRVTRTAASEESVAVDEDPSNSLRDNLLTLDLDCGHGTDEWMIIPWEDMDSDKSMRDYGKYASSSRVLSKWIDADGGAFERCLYEGNTCSKVEYLTKTFGVKAVLVRKIVLINFRQDARYDMYNDNLLQGLPTFCGEPSKAAKAALKKAKGKVLSKELVHDFILRLKETSIRHRVDQLCQAFKDVDEMTGHPIASQVARLLTSRQEQQSEPEPMVTRTRQSERRVTRTAASEESVAVDEDPSNSLRDNLLTLDLDCGHGTDEWMIIPWEDMDSDKSMRDYGKYASSSRVLSKWIDADGGDFERCLYEGNTNTCSKVEYLTKTFGVKAVLVRKIVLINFRQDARYDMYNDNLLQGLPTFCGVPSKAAKAALKKAKGKVLSKELVHDFILRLKETSIRHRVDQLCQAFKDVDEMTGHPISSQVARLLTSRQQQQSESDSEPRNTTPTSQAPAHNFFDCIPAVVSCVEVECNDNSNSDIVPMSVDTHTAKPQCSQAPLVSPTVECSVEDKATSDAKIQRKEKKRVEFSDQKAIQGLEVIYPRKSKRTVALLEANPKSHLLEWEGHTERSRDTTDERLIVKSVLHASSKQDINVAAEILSSILKKDRPLANKVVSKLGWKELTKIESFSELLSENNSVSETIADGIVEFSGDIYSRGSKPKQEQEAQNAAYVASLYAAEPDQLSSIGKRLKMTTQALKKARERVENMKKKKSESASATTGRVPIFMHHKRAIRSDSKREPAWPYVHAFCHANGYSRVSRVDTGETVYVRVITPDGKVERHPLRRFEEHSLDYQQVYEHWKKSEQAKQFAADYPKLKTIGIKLFRKLLCPCCKFSTHQMCADELMTGVEEARSAIQHACATKHFKEAIKICQCDFHCNEQFNSIFVERAEKLIQMTLCPAQDQPTLKRNAYPGFESMSEEKIPKLHSFDCINGKCQSSTCGVDYLFALVRKCPILFPPVDDTMDDDDEEEDGEEDDIYPVDDDRDVIVYTLGEDEGCSSEEEEDEEEDEADITVDEDEGDNTEEDEEGAGLPADDDDDNSAEEEDDDVVLDEEDSDTTVDDKGGNGNDIEAPRQTAGALDAAEAVSSDAVPSDASANRTISTFNSNATPECTIGCDWKDVIGGGCHLPQAPLGSTCGVCKRATHHVCHVKYAEKNSTVGGDGLYVRCSKCVLPPAVLREYPAEDDKADDIETAALDATEGEDAGVEENMSESELRNIRRQSKFKVKLWELVEIDRINRKQKELVQKKMTMSELIQHLQDLTEKARAHYVRYKCVDLFFDLLKYNTIPEDGRIVIFADYSANPDLRGRRTACGSIDTHAVVEVFIVYEYRKVAETNAAGETIERNVCIKRSHIFIGSSESAGKKNDWQFHISCLNHLIREYQSKRGVSEIIVEVAVITDRCPTQYLCRQNFLQVAKASKIEDSPVLKHYFACVSRFKGDHDAEGKVIKEGIRKLVLGGAEGTTAWDFYVAVKRKYERAEMNEKKEMNKLHERKLYFTVYSEEERSRLDQGEHEGDIVFADMNIRDDTDPIHATNKIHSVEGLKNFVFTSYEDIVDLEGIREELYELEHKDYDHSNDDEFLSTFGEEDYPPTPAELARFDFLQIERQLVEELDDEEIVMESLLDSTPQFRTEYLNEFLRRCGKRKPPKATEAKLNGVRNWLKASPIERLFTHRTVEHLKDWYEKKFPGIDKPPSLKRQIVGDILGIDLPKNPAKAKTAREYYRAANKERAKELNPNVTLKEVNHFLNSEFDGLGESDSYQWEEKARKDEERYERDLRDLQSGEEEGQVFYLMRSNLPGGCRECLSNNPDACVCPYRDQMKRRIVRMKVKQKDTDKDDDSCSEENDCFHFDFDM